MLLSFFMVEEERYTNRQIERMLESQTEDLKEHLDIRLEPIAVQVKKTNGRVNWIEKMVYLAIGALIILAPLMTWSLMQLVNLKDSLKNEVHTETQQAVQDALSHYNVQITP